MTGPQNRKLTKSLAVESIARATGLAKRDIQSVVEALFEEIKTVLLNDQIAEFRGFGSFHVRTRKGRDNARNPKTGEIFRVRNHGVVIFRPGKELKHLAWRLRN